MEKKRYFKRGSTSYRVLVLSIAFVILSVSILTPVFVVEGGNRTLGIVLACVLGATFILILLYFLYDWMKTKPISGASESNDREKRD